MRICLITETLRTGVGRHVVDLALGLRSRGHDLHVLHSLERVDGHFLSTLKDAGGIRCEGFPMRREPGPSDFAALRALSAHVRAHGPFDVLHGHSSKGGAYARLIGVMTGVPVVYTPHAFFTLDDSLSNAKRRFYKVVERGLALATERIVCVSEAEWVHGQALGIAAARLVTIENGLDMSDARHDRQAARAAIGIAADAIAIGFVGRLSGQKRPDLFVEAGIRAARHRDRLYFVIIGDGPMEQALRARIGEAGLEDRFIWMGPVDAQPLMPAFDLLAMPSRYEGASYTLLEALCAGVPVASTPVGSAPAIIVAGRTGFIVDGDCPTSLGEAMGRVADDPARRWIEPGEVARVRETYSVARMVSATEQVYESCLASPSRGRKLGLRRLLTAR